MFVRRSCRGLARTGLGEAAGVSTSSRSAVQVRVLASARPHSSSAARLHTVHSSVTSTGLPQSSAVVAPVAWSRVGVHMAAGHARSHIGLVAHRVSSDPVGVYTRAFATSVGPSDATPAKKDDKKDGESSELTFSTSMLVNPPKLYEWMVVKWQGTGLYQKGVVQWSKDAWVYIKHEAVFVKTGLKLLATDVRIASRLLRKQLRGESLTRREKRQLQRTTIDVFKLVPVTAFALIPATEFLLPFILSVFPNLLNRVLPSTFRNRDTEEMQKLNLLKVRMEMARFLQNTVSELAKDLENKQKHRDTAKDFGSFMAKVRSGSPVTNTELIKYSKMFEDEVTLSSFPRPQLVAMNMFMDLPTYGTDSFLQFQLRTAFRSLKADDIEIYHEGVDNLDHDELVDAVRARGMRAAGKTDLQLRRELSEWLDLSLVNKVPLTLLILSRAFMMTNTEHLSVGTNLENMLQVIPEQVLTQVESRLAQQSDKTEALRKELKYVQEQEELIKAENSGAELDEAEKRKKLRQIAQQITDMTEKTAADIEREVFYSLISDSNRTKDNWEQLKELMDATRLAKAEELVAEEKASPEAVADASASQVVEDEDTVAQAQLGERLQKRLDKLLRRIERQLENKTEDSDQSLVIIDSDGDGKVSLEELVVAMQNVKNPPTNEEIDEFVHMMDTDRDGFVSLRELDHLQRHGLVKVKNKDGQEIKHGGNQEVKQEG